MYTAPRTFGVYRLAEPRASKQHRFGNHPVRQRELETEFGDVELVALFYDRTSAQLRAATLNEN